MANIVPLPKRYETEPAGRRWVRKKQASLDRYTRAVGWMKVVLPIAALLMVGLIFVIGRERGAATDLFTAEELARLGAGLKLDQPRFAGVTDAGEPFVLKADWALPDSAMPEEIQLENPTAEVSLQDDRQIAGAARYGLMERSARTLTLTGGVRLETSDGYQFETEMLRVETEARAASTATPVTGTGPQGRIEAGSFRVRQVGERNSDTVIWFENGVRVLFNPGNKG